MNLLDYINGIRRGLDANRIEKDALRDTFTFEALEGYDSIKGEHSANISKLRKQIRLKNRQANNNNLFTRIAAVAAIIVFAIGGYMVLDLNNPNYSGQGLSAIDSKSPVAIINIFAPDDFYREHKISINNNNDTVKRKYLSANTKYFSTEDKTTNKVSEKEINDLSSIRNKYVIDIYIPNDDYQRNERKIAKGNNRTEIITKQSDSNMINIYIPTEEYSKQKRS